MLVAVYGVSNKTYCISVLKHLFLLMARGGASSLFLNDIWLWPDGETADNTRLSVSVPVDFSKAAMGSRHK